MYQYNGLEIGQTIRKLRMERGIGMGEFSDELGKSESHMKQVELGSRKMSLDLLYSLMRVLNVDANRILGICPKENSGEVSIDEKLKELPQSQREYLTGIFVKMIADYPAAA